MNTVKGTLWVNDGAVVNKTLAGWVVIAVQPRNKKDAKQIGRIFKTLVSQFNVDCRRYINKPTLPPDR